MRFTEPVSSTLSSWKTLMLLTTRLGIRVFAPRVSRAKSSDAFKSDAYVKQTRGASHDPPHVLRKFCTMPLCHTLFHTPMICTASPYAAVIIPDPRRQATGDTSHRQASCWGRPCQQPTCLPAKFRIQLYYCNSIHQGVRTLRSNRIVEATDLEDADASYASASH